MSLMPLLAIAPIALLSPSLLRAQSRAPKLEAAELPMAFEQAARPGEAPRFRARGQGYAAELTAEGADLLLAPRVPATGRATSTSARRASRSSSAPTTPRVRSSSTPSSPTPPTPEARGTKA